MPAHGSDASKLREDLARIRARVEAEDSDLRALGFWPIVSRVKRDPALIEALADEIGEIDRLAFEAKHRVRFSIGFGNLLLIAGTVALKGLVLWVSSLGIEIINLIDGWQPGDPRIRVGRFHVGWAGVALVVAAAGLSVTFHDLAHWAVGRLGGIRFRAYFLNGPFRIQPGIKTDYASYLRADPRRRARMHAAGAVASKLAPFAVGAWGLFVYLRYEFLDVFPAWSLVAVLAFGILQIVTDLVWSTKRSDWKKWARERRVAADLYSMRTPGSSGQPG